jgi:hypothetical protein
VGLGRRIVRKSVRKATPRSVRRAVHPVRTAKRAVTPRPVRQVSRALYTVTNPLGAAENKLIGAALNTGRSRSKARNTGRGRSNVGSNAISAASTDAAFSRQPSPRRDGSAEAADAHDVMAQLMAVQRERFTPAQRPIIPAPTPVNSAPWEIEEWALRKAETRTWQRARRRAVRAEVRAFAESKALEQFTRTQTAWQEQQRRADAWWAALNKGDPVVVRAALHAAFADNYDAPVIFDLDDRESTLVISLPAPNVLPRRQPHVTPSGKRSSKAWTETTFNQAYADLLGAHLLATIREAWHVAPSLDHLRVLGTRPVSSSTEFLFDVDVSRAGGYWDNDFSGYVVLAEAPRGLRRSSTGEPRPWPRDELRSLPVVWNDTV